MIYLGNQAVGLVNNASLPSFINHLDSGTILLESGNSVWIQLSTVQNLKGLLIFNNDFNLGQPQANRPFVGAYGALYLAGSNEWSTSNQGYKIISDGAYYFTNNLTYPSPRTSRTESRGVPYYDTENNRVYFYGFGTGDYDFKYNIPYHWIAWD